MSTEALQVISIRSDLDIIAARMAAREIARKLGFSAVDQARIATATSELSRNILVHAEEGNVTIREIHAHNKRGIELIFEDKGPGIANANGLAQDDTVAPGKSGFGLSGSRRLMDQMDIETTIGVGTRIICQKWLR
ncbi:MAG: anti-sigma regulatory factor [Chloroflexaceae bacterium]|nr:anti-sigma regulatory factor [Chloroflexaceae bacterium]